MHVTFIVDTFMMCFFRLAEIFAARHFSLEDLFACGFWL